MLDLMKKSLLTGLGLALKTKDEVEDLANDLIKKGKMSEKDGRKFIKDLMDKWDSSRDKLENRVEKSVNEFFKKTNVVTADELKAVKKEIRDLKKAISDNVEKSSQ
jgi:polyhydroxyalkanoate synthesis regulator phasin